MTAPFRRDGSFPLGGLFDSLVVDAPIPPETLHSSFNPATRSSFQPVGTQLDAAAVSAFGELTGRVGVWLTGSPGSALLASWLCSAGADAIGVTASPADALAVDDAGDAAAWYRLRRVHIDLDAGLAGTWRRLVDLAPVPVPDLRAPNAALLCQLAKVDVLLVDDGFDDWSGHAEPVDAGGLAEADIRQHYGCVPLRLAEWRRRLALRRELIDPELGEAHPTALACPPRAPLAPELLAELDPAAAALRLELAGRLAGSVRPLLAAASELAASRIWAPFAEPALAELFLSARGGPKRALRRLVADRVPRDLSGRPPRRPPSLEPRWLLAEPLPPGVAEGLATLRLARRGWFDPVTTAHWLQALRSAPDEPTNQLRGRMLLIAASLELLATRLSS